MNALFSFVEERLQASIAGPADRQARAVAEDGKPAVPSVRLNADDPFQIHDVRAVNSYEAIRIETGFEAGDGLLLEMFFALAGQGDVIVLSFHIIEPNSGNERHARAVFDHQTLQELLRRSRSVGKFL